MRAWLVHVYAAHSYPETMHTEGVNFRKTMQKKRTETTRYRRDWKMQKISL